MTTTTLSEVATAISEIIAPKGYGLLEQGDQIELTKNKGSEASSF